MLYGVICIAALVLVEAETVELMMSTLKDGAVGAGVAVGRAVGTAVGRAVGAAVGLAADTLI